MTPEASEPARDCPLCPRLAAFRESNRAAHPDWFNGAVPSLGEVSAPLLIVGLAPGLRGATRSGIPFTGDSSGSMLCAALATAGLRDPTSGRLRGTRITNALACVPPGNRPTGAELATCRPFLAARIAGMPRLAAVLTLGRLAHDSTLRALGLRPSDLPFAHGAEGRAGRLTLIASYHCSRLNTATGRLTPAMLASAVERAREAAGL